MELPFACLVNYTTEVNKHTVMQDMKLLSQEKRQALLDPQLVPFVR